MLPGHESPPRAGRSGFVAAFLSLLFPGLGHAYLGAYRRGLGFAAPPLLIGALIAGIVVRMNAFDLAGLAVQNWFLIGLFIANLVALAYRAFAIVDAWAIAQAAGRGQIIPRDPAGRNAAMLSIAGVIAVLLVMSTIHIAVARYDLLLAGTEACVFVGEGSGGSNCTNPEPSSSAGPGDTSGDDTPEPVDTGAGGTVGPIASADQLPPWNGKDRLNILLIGADEQRGAHNTDTMIVVSIDPSTHQVVMFSLPRDTADVPIPAKDSRARAAFGSTYQGKINSYWVAVHNRPDWYAPIPGITGGPGYNGLMSILGNLYQLDIHYFIEVNFAGFQEVVDAVGGVTVDVDVPVLDDTFPLFDGSHERLYIPAGTQHMDGVTALQYARSRHGSSDFDRGARQQRVLLAIRRQADIPSLLPKVTSLLDVLKKNVRTNIPRELIPQLASLAQQIDTGTVRSVIFTPPFYAREVPNSSRGYIIEPNVTRIRKGVKDAFTVDPAFQQAHDELASEGAQVWVLNGSGRLGEAASLAAYFEYLGIAATAPGQKPPAGATGTVIRVYNGAEDQIPLTIQALQTVLGVQAVTVTDPSIHVDVIVITGDSTPSLTAPPAP
jgi:LCP family protein required for cell wall assembly